MELTNLAYPPLTELNRTHTGPNAPVEQTRTADDRLEDRDDSLPI